MTRLLTEEVKKMSILEIGKKVASSVFKIVDLIWCGVDGAKEKALEPLIERIPICITPNFLSWLRIALALCIAIMLFQRDIFKGVIVVYFVVAAFSDILDGQIARKRKMETDEGAFLDRLGDKLLICPLIVCFFWRYYILVSLIVVVEFLSLFVLVSTESNQPAKWKMAAEGIGIIMILLFPEKIAWARVPLICALVFGALSFREHRISFRSQNGAE